MKSPGVFTPVIRSLSWQTHCRIPTNGGIKRFWVEPITCFLSMKQILAVWLKFGPGILHNFELTKLLCTPCLQILLFIFSTCLLPQGQGEAPGIIPSSAWRFIIVVLGARLSCGFWTEQRNLGTSLTLQLVSAHHSYPDDIPLAWSDVMKDLEYEVKLLCLPWATSVSVGIFSNASGW